MFTHKLTSVSSAIDLKPDFKKKKKPLTYNIAILGSKKVGKSSLIRSQIKASSGVEPKIFNFKCMLF